jgi:Zn-dependent protease with chaperone function
VKPRAAKLLTTLLIGIVLTTGALEAQKRISPGWNLFSPEQDVQLGQEAATEIEKQVTVVNDKALTDYVAGIGKRLADASPAPDYPYTFKVVADPSINAFALPGGPIFVHTGLLTASDNEAQMAGVLAHEVGHVALRHSTNRASKAQIFQIPLVLAGGMLEQKGGMLGALSQIGIGFGLNSVFMKYSRSAEKDADILGARMMADVGYEPREMATFFQKLEESGGGAGGPEFFSDHPNPGNRVEYVNEEIEYLPSKTYNKGDQRRFAVMKARAARVKMPEKPKEEGTQPGKAGASSSSTQQTGAPARNVRYTGAGYEMVHPGEWKAHSANQGTAVTILPPNGLIQANDGRQSLARGVMAGFFEPRSQGLAQKTNELIGDLQQSNPGLEPIRGKRNTTNLRGQPAESLLLAGNSPVSDDREVVWLVATERPQGLFYIVFVSPESEYQQHSTTFQNVLRSIVFP